MAESVISNFPPQAVSDAEKMSDDYGLRVGLAIEQEWFAGSTSRYLQNYNEFHKRRLYSRGEQPTQKYKNELAIDGDLSYLNLDWKPVPIVPKFVDIIVNGMAERDFTINCFSQDPFGVYERTEYMESMIRDMEAREYNDAVAQSFGIDLYENKQDTVPNSEEELKLHMQLDYKLPIELANEQGVATLMENSRFSNIRRKVLKDLTVLGVGATRTTFDFSQGAEVEYCDPANMVWSYTEDPFFEDIYYVGEVKEIPINELVREFPHLSEADVAELEGSSYNLHARNNLDRNKVHVLYFNYKTHAHDVYKLKTTGSGGEKVIPKDDSFNPPADMEGDYSRLDRIMEVLYEGVLVLGCRKLLRWRVAPNMLRSESDYGKVKMNYQICAPRMYRGRFDSVVSRIEGFADQIQMAHLKLQQVANRIVPDGVYLDADGLTEIDLGNGTSYNPAEALRMFFQTGSVVGRSFTGDGDMNPGKVPIQQIQNGVGSNKIQSLITLYNYYLQMIRDTTGLNEARDGSMPDSNTLVGVQQMAAANSNTATNHILHAMSFITVEAAENLSMRISDVIEYGPTADAFIKSIGMHNFATLEELRELHLRDFGIFIELAADAQQRQFLENNIQVALSKDLIDIDDAIDIRTVQNMKLANQLLKIKKKLRAEQRQEMNQRNIQAQSDANAQMQQVTAQTEAMKQEAKSQAEIAVEKAKGEVQKEVLLLEEQVKLRLMEREAQLARGVEIAKFDNKHKQEAYKEDRKDARVDRQAEHTSTLNREKEQQKAVNNFESSGNDIVTGDTQLRKYDI